MKPRGGSALILGASGQDGAYLAELLVRRGLDVHGTSRDKEVSGYFGLRRLGIYDRVTVHSVVLSDFRSVVTVLNDVRPALIFNLAAQSSVGLSFEQPVETIDSIMHGTINVMEVMRFIALGGKLSGGLWAVRLQRAAVQSRVAAATGSVRHSEDRSRCCRHCRWPHRHPR